MAQPIPSNFLQVPQPTQERSFRVPSPPRIFVPPPIVTPLSQNLDFIQKIKDFESSEQIGAEFLRTVTHNNFEARDHVLDWKYEERRTAQEILPFLFLGPVSAVRDRVWLQVNGITMVLGVRDMFSAQARLLAPKVPEELGIPLVNIDVRGTPQLTSAFPQAISTINAHLSERYRLQQSAAMQNPQSSDSRSTIPGRVLVFCESGNERSATLVAAYIMAMYSLNMVSAIQVVQSQRFCIALDDALKWTLSSYQDILAAKRDVASAAVEESEEATRTGPAQELSGTLYLQVKRSDGRKRSVERVYEEEVVMDDADDDMTAMVGDERRTGSAPFSG